MADRVLVMHEGRLAAEHPPRRGHRGERHVRRDRAAAAMSDGDDARRQAAPRPGRSARSLVDTGLPGAGAEPGRGPGASWSACTAVANPRFLSGQGVKDILLNASILALLAVGPDGRWSSPATSTCRSARSSAWSPSPPATSSSADHGSGHRLRGDPGHRDRRRLRAGQRRCWSASAGCPPLVVTLGTLYVIQGIDYYLGARAADQRRRPARPAAATWATAACSACPYLPLITVAGHAGRRRTTCAPTRRPGALRHRLQPRGRARSPASRSGGASWPPTLLSGALAGLAGVLWLARFGTVVADAAHGWELSVVAAVVVGGVAIVGGVGTRLRRGARRPAAHHDRQRPGRCCSVNPFWQQAITGALLLAGHQRRPAAGAARRPRCCEGGTSAMADLRPHRRRRLPGRRPCRTSGERRPAPLGRARHRAAVVVVVLGGLGTARASRARGNLSFALGDLGRSR